MRHSKVSPMRLRTESVIQLRLWRQILIRTRVRNEAGPRVRMFGSARAHRVPPGRCGHKSQKPESSGVKVHSSTVWAVTLGNSGCGAGAPGDPSWSAASCRRPPSWSKSPEESSTARASPTLRVLQLQSFREFRIR